MSAAKQQQQQQQPSPPRRMSQFGDLDDGVMSRKKWEERWAKGQTRFHQKKVHKQLRKHVHLLTQDKANQRVFLPLCGKSLDMKWLAEQGHDVYGNEFVAQGCREFYEEHNIDYTVEPIAGTTEGYIFKSKDPKLRVTLYCCNFFKMTKDLVGELDCVWDRGSLAAVNPSERKPYAEKMATLLSPNTRYVVEIFELDNTHFSGPPHNFPEEEIRGYFDGSCSLEQVDRVDAMTDWQREWGIDSFFACDYFIALK